ncbi:MAG: ferredoxin [Elusimicrobia bacterium RIFOXYA2_FULL_39_19]|nr:MAG: ferredoxin [Elusimicrobia bacterium RIFOXYA2_FULL_39_19]
MELKNSKDLPIGGKILQAGNAQEYTTGEWRNEKPVLDKSKCINCLFCWIYCPDSSVYVEEGKVTGFDYDHCKGCGICAYMCPKKCIAMQKEEK